MKRATVFFTPVGDGESPESMAAKAAALARAAGFERVVSKGQPCAVKQHFGEDKNIGYVRPEITASIAAFIKSAGGDPFVTDTNTLYKGNRSRSTDHLRQAAAHGFTIEALGAPVLIADGLYGADQVAVKLPPGLHFKEVRIAAALHQAAACVVLTHVKGHCEMGLGGSIKNIGMGCAARAGKLAQHQGGAPAFNAAKCTGCGTCVRWCPAGALALHAGDSGRKKARLTPEKCIGCGECLALCPANAIGFEWSTGGPALIEKVCEHALGLTLNKPLGVGYLNFITHVTKNCDCFGTRQKAERPNVGIVASTDVVAVDKAAADLCRERFSEDVWAAWWPKSRYETMFAYGEKIGLGCAEYDVERV